MIAKFLGIIDLACMLVLIFAGYLPSQFVMFFAMLLFAKGIIFAFLGDRVSVLDAIGGIYMGLIVYGVSYYIITVFFIIMLGQKGLLSLLARG